MISGQKKPLIARGFFCPEIIPSFTYNENKLSFISHFYHYNDSYSCYKAHDSIGFEWSGA